MIVSLPDTHIIATFDLTFYSVDLKFIGYIEKKPQIQYVGEHQGYIVSRNSQNVRQTMASLNVIWKCKNELVDYLDEYTEYFNLAEILDKKIKLRVKYNYLEL